MPEIGASADAVWLRQHRVPELLDQLVQHLLLAQPQDPLHFLQRWLWKQKGTGPRILVTGGAGYIGSHTTVELVAAGYPVVVVDNLCNSSEEAIRRVRQLVPHPEMVSFHKVDLCDPDALETVFRIESPIYAVIHFAGLKAVGESVAQPLRYYENNLKSTFNLLRCMERQDCRRLVFSSSATVYGSAPIPYTEVSQVGVGVTNPYGRTKFMIEEILRDIHASPDGKDWTVELLRYFNPVGAHPSGLIGEDPNGIPNNLMPYLSQVAVGKRALLTIFGGPGNDPYPTPDGTCQRDFIHVMDLAEGHVAAIRRIQAVEPGACEVFNLGSGQPVSVLELVAAFQEACGKPLPYTIGTRRPGDLPAFWANPEKAAKELNWRTTRSVADMCRDAWAWQSKNPNGCAAPLIFFSFLSLKNMLPPTHPVVRWMQETPTLNVNPNPLHSP
eukprot:EG_transcript_11581